jgi:hypothetical protein
LGLPGPPALPRKDRPSCCYLLSRVLTRPRYDAHRLRQASGVSYALEALTTTTRRRLALSSTHPLVSFSQLQGLQHALTPLERGISLGFFTFSAVTGRRVGQGSIPARVPSPGFRNLLTGKRLHRRAGLFHPAGTPRVGGLQRMTAHRSPDRFPPAFAPSPLPRPSWSPFDGPRSSTTCRAGVSPRGDQSAGSSSPCGDRPHLGLESVLKLYSRSAALPTPDGFTRRTRLHLSWPSLLQGFSLWAPWTNQPFWGFDPSRACVHPEMAIPLARNASPLEVFAFWPELPLRTQGYRGYCFPSGTPHLSPNAKNPS